MRIGIDARFYGTLGKGLGRYTEKLIQALESLATEDEFVIFLRRENFDEYVPHSKNFSKVLADFPWYGWQEQILFPRLLWKYQLDLMHFPHFNVPVLYRRALTVTIHDLILLHYPTVKASELSPFLYWIKYLAYRFIIGSAVKRAQTIFTVSHFTEHDIASVYPKVAHKICMTYEAADIQDSVLTYIEEEKMLAQLGLAARGKGMPYVLYVGNAYPHKNLNLLLEVAALLPEKLFVCVGREDYFYRDLKNRSKHRGLKNVRFVGFVPDRFLPALYREAESYFFPSLYEGFGLPALEALSFGTPVVAARRGALPEIIGEAGVFFNPENLDEVHRKLELIGKNQPLRERMVRLGYERVKTFSWTAMAAATLREYHRKAK